MQSQTPHTVEDEFLVVVFGELLAPRWRISLNLFPVVGMLDAVAVVHRTLARQILDDFQSLLQQPASDEVDDDGNEGQQEEQTDRDTHRKPNVATQVRTVFTRMKKEKKKKSTSIKSRDKKCSNRRQSLTHFTWQGKPRRDR